MEGKMNNRPERQATLCIVMDKEKKKILLGMKKRGFGVGKYNGFGGKPLPGETIEAAALREFQEESELRAELENLKKVAEMDFFFPHQPEFDQTMHAFLVEKWDGEPRETEEMAFEWFDLNKIPYDKMWDDDKYWLPKVLDGKILKAKFVFKLEGNEHVNDRQEIDELVSF
jgi:8-oxo-dGTP pyrophosphatase MutT (NUDIX family)